MNKFLTTLLCLLCFCHGNIKAGVPDTAYKTMKDTAHFISLLKTYNANLISIESDFVQLKTMKILKDAVKSKGFFCFKNGPMIRWEYTEPFRYLIIINNGKMFVRDGEKNNSYDFTASESFKKLSAILGGIVKGDVLSDKNDFSCRFLENNVTYKLILTPLAGDVKDYFRDFVLVFDKKMFSVSHVQMNEVSGDVTDIWFNNRKINSGVSDELFIIK